MAYVCGEWNFSAVTSANPVHSYPGLQMSSVNRNVNREISSSKHHPKVKHLMVASYTPHFMQLLQLHAQKQ